MDSNSDDESEQIRISLVLAPGVKDKSLEVPSEPIAVPASIRRKGLSAVVNTLLDRDIPSAQETDSESESDEDGDSEKLPSIPFDFILNRKLLRVSVDAGVRREGLSLEEAVEIQYFPALNAPEGEGDSKSLPDWISAMSFHGINNKGMGHLCTGSYDGSIHVFDCSNEVKEISSIGAHTGPIKCISSLSIPDSLGQSFIATGSMDQTLLTHSFNNAPGNAQNMNLHAVYSGGHFNSVESVAMQYSNSKHSTIMASGDWNGGLCLWKVPTGKSETEDLISKSNPKGSKKRRTGRKDNITETSDDQTIELQPKSSWKAHISNVSALAWAYSNDNDSNVVNPNHLISSSWDHSLKVWDIDQEECILTLNGSRVVACMNRCSNSNIVATGHPDCTVRLWDMRTGKGEAGSSVSDGTLKPSHRSWVSSLQWSPKEPHVLATNSHDGCVKMWDIRSSLPLHTIRAHEQGQKGLCLAFTEDYLFSGGTDCKVHKFGLN